MSEQDDQQARRGYLLLADISGYTAFLTGTELEDGGTSVHWRWRLQDRGPEVRQRFEISAAAMRADGPAGRARLTKAIEEDAAALALDNPTVQRTG